MSAIAGLICWDGAPAGPFVRLALDRLALHGRDGQGLWDGGDAALGWRQTVLTAEDRGDSQPLDSGDGRYKFVFDGRIDNREELARAFSLSPEQARSWPDSAYALAGFERWGEACMAHLLGDFAFAAWDTVERRLTLVRDHIGTRPVYFYRTAAFVIFATAPSALFLHPGVPRDLDDDEVLLSLTPVPWSRDGTIYRDIRRVPIGHLMVFSAEAVRKVEHWKPEDLPALPCKRDEEYVEAFRELLDDSVRCRLRTLHPVGSHLSSGWDSSTVTAVAARLLGATGRRLTAYSAVPPLGWQRTPRFGWLSDEGPAAAVVAKHYANIDHVLIRGTGTYDFAPVDRYTDAFEIPVRALNNAGWMDTLHHEARERGIRVMLTGGMGNRTLSHDGHTLLPQLLRRGRWLRLLVEMDALRRNHPTLRKRGIVGIALNPYLPDWLSRFVQRRWSGRDLLPGPGLFMTRGERLSPSRLEAIMRERNPFGHAFRSGDDRALWHWGVRTPDLGRIWGATLAAYDIELRDPLGDRRIMAFRARVPEDQFLRHGRDKWFVQRVAEGILPAEFMTTRLRGRQAAEWYEAAYNSRASLLEEVARCRGQERLAAAFDFDRIEALLNNWPESLNAEHESQVQQLLFALGTARFMRRFFKSAV
jgi:asparagine synthase (glutamine-hydrolysing)